MAKIVPPDKTASSVRSTTITKPLNYSLVMKVELRRANKGPLKQPISPDEWKADQKALMDALKKVKTPNGSKVDVVDTGVKSR